MSPILNPKSIGVAEVGQLKLQWAKGFLNCQRGTEMRAGHWQLFLVWGLTAEVLEPQKQKINKN